MDDVVVAMVFGLIGYLMDRFNFSRANFVIGMVLAMMIERNLHLSLSLYGGDFIFTRPVTLAMFILLLVTTALPFVRKWRRRKAAEPRRRRAGEPAMSRRIQENLVLCAVLAIFIAAIVACTGYGARARVVPLPIATLGAMLTVAQLVLQNLPGVGDLHLDALELFTSHAPGAAAAKPAAKRGKRRAGRDALAAGTDRHRAHPAADRHVHADRPDPVHLPVHLRLHARQAPI